MSDVKIIKNVMEYVDFQNLSRTVKSQEFEWHYHENQSHLLTDGEYFDHCLYNNFEINSHAFNLIRPLLDKLNVKALVQARLNLLIAKETHQFSEFHKDYSYECKTAIFYINTCNGYTELFDDKKTKIISQENKVVIFNSQINHRAVSQTDNKRRIVLNLNYF